MITAILAHFFVLASTYGSGAYNAGSYNGTVQVGPFTLPVTGAGLSIILGVLAIAVAAGVIVWLRQKRKPTQPTE